MVRTFIKLSLRQWWNGMRGSGFSGWFQVILLVLVVGVPTIAAAGLLASTRWTSNPGATRLVLIFGALFGLGLLNAITPKPEHAPMDPVKFEMFPLTPRQRVTGLLVAEAVGALPIATLFIAIGAIVGYVPWSPTGALGLACAITFALVSVVVGRSLAGVLRALNKTRRSRDITAVVVAIMSASFYLLISRAGDLTGGAISGSVQLMPPGALAKGILAARDGEVFTPLLAIGYSAVWVALAVFAWVKVVSKAPAFRPSHTRVRTVGPGVALIPFYAPWLPPNRFGAVAAREFRYHLFRNPPLLGSMVFVVVYPLVVGGSVFRSGTSAPFIVVYPLFFAGATLGQMFTMDGPALWTQVVASGRPHDDLRAKLFVRACILGVVVIGLLIVATALTRDPLVPVVGALVSIGMFGITGGCGAALSVRSKGQGGTAAPGCASSGAGCLISIMQYALLLPGAAVLALSVARFGTALPGAWAVAAYGLSVGWLFLHNAERYIDTNMVTLALASASLADKRASRKASRKAGRKAGVKARSRQGAEPTPPDQATHEGRAP